MPPGSLVALFLLLFYRPRPRRRHRARDLRGLHVRGDPCVHVTLTFRASPARSSRSESRPTRTWSSSSGSRKKCGPGRASGTRSPPDTPKGFHTIIDANGSTAHHRPRPLRGGDRPGQGLRLMLPIGTAVSLITAAPDARLPGLLASFKWSTTRTSWGCTATKSPEVAEIDFMGTKRRRFGSHATPTRLIFLLLVVKGLNLGIDFKGGTQTTFSHSARRAWPRCATRRPWSGRAPPSCRVRGSSSVRTPTGSSRFARGRSLEDPQHRTFINDLRTKRESDHSRFDERLLELRPRDRQGRDPRDRRAPCPCIVLYITLRFQCRFADPARSSRCSATSCSRSASTR